MGQTGLRTNFATTEQSTSRCNWLVGGLGITVEGKVTEGLTSTERRHDLIKFKGDCNWLPRHLHDVTRRQRRRRQRARGNPSTTDGSYAVLPSGVL